MLQTLWVTLIEGIVLLFFTTYLVWRYADKKMPIYVKAITVLSWFLAFNVVLFLPLDIYLVSTTKQLNPFLISWWYFNYWTEYFLSFLLIPLISEYLGAGEFTFKEKLKRSIKNNIPWYIFYVVSFVILVLILASNEQGRQALSQQGLIGCMIGINLAIGFLYLVILLGYGLVQIPIKYYKYSQYENELRFMQFKVADYQQQFNKKCQRVQEILQITKNIQIPLQYHPYYDHLIEKIDQFKDQCTKYNIDFDQIMPSRTEKFKIFTGMLSYQNLVKLHQILKTETADAIRLAVFKKESTENAILLQDIINARNNKQNKIISVLMKPRDEKKFTQRLIQRLSKLNTILKRFLVYFWYAQAKPILLIVIAIIFALLSILILYAQFANFMNFKNTLINNMVDAGTQQDQDHNGSYIATNIACIIPLLYLVNTSFIGLFDLKISGIYSLHDHHQTDPSCLLFSTNFLMRLAVPIGYNFLSLTKQSQAAFYKVMGPVTDVKFLGEYFNKWAFPLCLFLMVILTAFNIYGRILNCLGLKQYAFDTSYTNQKIDNGKNLIDDYRSERFSVCEENFSPTSETQSDIEQKIKTINNKINNEEESDLHIETKSSDMSFNNERHTNKNNTNANGLKFYDVDSGFQVKKVIHHKSFQNSFDSSELLVQEEKKEVKIEKRGLKSFFKKVISK